MIKLDKVNWGFIGCGEVTPYAIRYPDGTPTHKS